MLDGQFAEYEIVRAHPFRGLGEIYIAFVRRLKPNPPEGLGQGTNVLIKVARVSTQAAAESARYLTIVNEALRAEIPRLLALPKLPVVARTFDFGARAWTLFAPTHQALRVETIFLVQEWIKGGQHLRAHLRRHYGVTAQPKATQTESAASAVKPEFFGIRDVGAWFNLAEKLAGALKQVHDTTTVHRDIKPTNIVIRDGLPVFVDLGEAIFRKVPVPPATRDVFRQRRKAVGENADSDVAYIAPEQRNGALSSSRRSDIFSLGAILYYIAKGRAPNFVGIQNLEALKTAVALELGGTVADDNAGIEDIISRCLRNDPDTRIQSASALLQDIRLFMSSSQPRSTDFGAIVIKIQGKVNNARNEVFAQFAAVEVGLFEETLDGFAEGSIVIEGDHDRIVRRLCAYLATLGEGDEYWTISVPEFWKPENAGIQGRYLSMNLEAARRGARIQRIFVLTDEDGADPEIHAIVHAQVEMEARLRRLNEDGRERGSISTRYVVMTAKEKKALIDRGEQIGIWIKDNSIVTLRPIYDRFTRIRAVQLTEYEQDRSVLAARFEALLNSSKPLDTWVGLPKSTARR